ncbi:aspartate 1-decarboxylase [Streptomyces sp. AC550_RSS872]|uniref:aspartate 1-decarboxylase n=1 Tax=Streptomyces sp. AC550_RSS872 TaxID=2823689 RepID=UPI001C2534C6|nr:aspartate 1-decarboxylase [Streptomyces sp. AC550_RSS872]
MQRTPTHAKIHRTTAARADLHYAGSLTTSCGLTTAAGIAENEKAQGADVTNGARLETHATAGAPGPGMTGVNGTADEHRPHVVHVDAANRQIQLGHHPAKPVPGDTTRHCGRS